MKRIIVMIMVAVMATFGANAAQMCADENTTTIVLDPSIQGIGYTYDTPSFTWQTNFSYGTINGVAACLTSNYDQVRGGAVAGLTDAGETVVGGELNGAHCWCKMTHPAASLWVFFYTYGSGSSCAGSCAYNCGYHVRNRSGMRGGLFGSVRN